MLLKEDIPVSKTWLSSSWNRKPINHNPYMNLIRTSYSASHYYYYKIIFIKGNILIIFFKNSGYPAGNGSKKLRTGTGTGLDRLRILGTGTTHIGSGSGTDGSEAVPVPKAGTWFRCSPLMDTMH